MPPKHQAASATVGPQTQGPLRTSGRRLLACTAVAGAGALLSAEAADASPIYFDIPDELISNGTFDLDVDDDGVVDFTLSHSVLGGEFLLEAQGSAANNGIVGYPSFSYYAWALDAGDPIGPGSAFVPDFPYGGSDPVVLGYRYGSYTYGSWAWTSEDRYLGFRFDVAGVGEHYGWARLSVDANSLSATLKDFAYESVPGEGIGAGALQSVPEPHPLALFAMGAAGLGMWRKRKTQAE